MSEVFGNYVLRPATPIDIPQIVNLMRDMAIFEKMLDQFEATEDAIFENVFGKEPAAKALVITPKDQPDHLISYVFWFHNYSTFKAKRGLYLEDIYIAPEHRNQGLGSFVLKHLAQKAVELNCGRFEWVVLDWNQNAIEFYQHHGARVLPEWRIVRLEGDALRELSSRSLKSSNKTC